MLFASLGVAGMVVMATQVSRGEAIVMVVVMALATVHWLVVKGER
jgi:hypothetical protein